MGIELAISIEISDFDVKISVWLVVIRNDFEDEPMLDKNHSDQPLVPHHFNSFLALKTFWPFIDEVRENLVRIDNTVCSFKHTSLNFIIQS